MKVIRMCRQLRQLSTKLEIMETVIHFLTEPDHLMFLAALAVMLVGKTDRRWLAVFTAGGLAWVIASHILIG